MNVGMRKLFFIVVLTLLAFGATAQQGGRPISFDQALDMTLNDNPQVSANKHQIRAAQMERKAAIGLRFPQIGVTGAYMYMQDDIGINMNGLRDGLKGPVEGIWGAIEGMGLPIELPDIAPLFKQNWGIELLKRDLGMIAGTVTVPIYMGGKINAANRAARINEKSARQESTETENALVSELVERYFGLSLANSVVEIRRQVVSATERHLHDAIKLEENGMIARSERLYMEVKLSEAERELIAAQLNAETIQSALQNTLNSEERYEPISAMFILPRIEPKNYYKSEALERNPLLKQVGLKRELAEQDVVLKRSEFLPKLTAIGSYNVYNYHVPKIMPDWVVGAGISINIFNGLNKEFKLSAAKNTVRRVESLEHKANNDILILVDKLYAEIQNYADRVPSINKSLEFAEEYLRVKNAAFREGAASAVDVIDAELNLASTRIEKLETAYRYDLMLAKLLEAAGMSDKFIGYQRNPAAEQVVFE